MEIWFSTTCLKPLIRSQLGLQSRWVWIHFTLVGLCCTPPPLASATPLHFWIQAHTDQDSYCIGDWLKRLHCIRQYNQWKSSHFFCNLGAQDLIRAARRIGEDQCVYLTWRLRPALKVCCMQMKNEWTVLFSPKVCWGRTNELTGHGLLSGLVSSCWRRSGGSHNEFF